MVTILKEHTLQRAFVAVNEESPIYQIAFRSAEFSKKTGDISAVYEVFLLAEVALFLISSTKESDTHVFTK